MKEQSGRRATALPLIQGVHEVRPEIQDNTILKQTEEDTRFLLWCIVKLWKVCNLAFVNLIVGNAGSVDIQVLVVFWGTCEYEELFMATFHQVINSSKWWLVTSSLERPHMKKPIGGMSGEQGG
jgi:hypothetical protein